MTVARFEGGDPVARYWLAHCEGFATKGATRGVVEELIRDADPHVTSRLVIRTRARRRRIISAGAVSEVIPAESVLIVARRHARRNAHRSPRASLSARGRVGLVRVAHAFPGGRRRAGVFARVAWSVGRSWLLVLARSFRSLTVELRATGRMLRPGPRSRRRRTD
jgi:hypothetical protein